MRAAPKSKPRITRITQIGYRIRPMKYLPFLLAIGFAGQTAAQKTHRLEATPQTVAYGYYDAAAKPVLRIASGDIIDVDTLLTNTPPRLESAGVPADQIQQSLRTIVAEVKD